MICSKYDITAQGHEPTSESVNALLIPPLALRNLAKESSSGYFSVPRKSMCSQKCAWIKVKQTVGELNSKIEK